MGGAECCGKRQGRAEADGHGGVSEKESDDADGVEVDKRGKDGEEYGVFCMGLPRICKMCQWVALYLCSKLSQRWAQRASAVVRRDLKPLETEKYLGII